MTTINGEVCFSKISAAFIAATLIIFVEDSSRIDAAAKVISEHQITNVSRSPAHPDPVPFTIELPPSENAGQLSCRTLRVHVDVDSSGQVSPGDYVSTQSYPLDTLSSTDFLRIVVHPVE